jgi:hypothetical protein
MLKIEAVASSTDDSQAEVILSSSIIDEHNIGGISKNDEPIGHISEEDEEEQKVDDSIPKQSNLAPSAAKPLTLSLRFIFDDDFVPTTVLLCSCCLLLTTAACYILRMTERFMVLTADWR